MSECVLEWSHRVGQNRALQQLYSPFSITNWRQQGVGRLWGEGRKGWEGTSRDAASSVGPSLYILCVNWWFKERLWFRMCVIPKISLQHSRDINSSSPSPSGPYTRPSSPTASATSTSHTKPMTEGSSRRRTFVICTYDGNCWDAY